MNQVRLIKKDEANKKVPFVGIEINEYFTEQIPYLGLATARINGSYPPSSEAYWSINERVDEMWYVLDGHAKVIFEDGRTVELEPDSAVHFPWGMKYRAEDADNLHIVVATSPTWTINQHKWLSE